MISRPLISYILKAARRDRFFLSLFAGVIVALSLSVFLGSSAIIESDQFALVFSAAGLRLIGMAGLVLFVVFYIRRSFDARDIDFLLTRPLGRTAFLLSHTVALSLLAFLVALAMAAAVFVFLPHKDAPGFPLWAVSLVSEFIIMANAALFFSMVLSSVTSGAFASFGLYALARLIGEILGIISAGLPVPGFGLLSKIMQFVSLVVPRLDLMAQTSWLLYTPDGTVGLGFVVLQGMVFTGLLTAAALVDLLRRQF